MSALSANKIVVKKAQPAIKKLKCVDGALQIYNGGFVVYEASNIGYVMTAEDTLLAEFAGIALEEITKAAADNTSDGDFEVEVLQRGCGQEVLMDVTSTITIANEGDPVYVDTDNEVDIASGIENTTGGFVGIIRQFVSANKAWVQMVQSPSL